MNRIVLLALAVFPMLFGHAFAQSPNTGFKPQINPVFQDTVKRTSPADVKELLDRNEPVMIVDVRTVAEFKAEHIAGAVSIPVDQVPYRLGELPKNRDIVFY